MCVKDDQRWNMLGCIQENRLMKNGRLYDFVIGVIWDQDLIKELMNGFL